MEKKGWGPMNANDALGRMKLGNERFRTGRTEGVVIDGPHREELKQGQQPFAILLSCSDSRVPPEILFDTGLGDLFVVRVAGNVANMSSIASIEYAVLHLGSKLIVVMAHESCGAVGAAIAGGDAGKHLNRLLSHIQPALDPPDKDDNVIARRNARVSAERMINESDILRSAVENDGVKIVTAFFHFSDGEVEFD
jgi:carbonic anhydrase